MTRTISLQNFLGAARQTLIDHGDTPETIDNLVEAGSHPYSCRCPKCKKWWSDMGPDPDTGRYGPFEAWEIEGSCSS